MPDLGELGVEGLTLPGVTFTWFGEPVRSHPDLSDLTLADFLNTNADVDMASSAGLVAVKDAARLGVHPEDFDSFWKAALKHRVGSSAIFSVVTQIVNALTEEATDRPTELPAGSPSGQGSTSGNSAVDSSSPATAPATLPGGLPLTPRRRLELAGRPDLAEHILLADQALAAAKAG